MVIGAGIGDSGLGIRIGNSGMAAMRTADEDAAGDYQSRIPNPLSRAQASACAVVRRFLGDLHVVDVALA
ncbi:MAG: hypothetical protein DI592_19985, partial [Stenotrophomonas maltophilia]